MTRILHHIGYGIAQPDPIAAAHHAPRTLGPSLAHLGARFGAALLFRARNRRPAKFFGRQRHVSVSVNNFQRGSSYRKEVPGCGKSRLEIEKQRRVA